MKTEKEIKEELKSLKDRINRPHHIHDRWEDGAKDILEWVLGEKK